MTIVSRLCINHLQSARVRREQYVGQWLPEPLLIDSHDPQDIVRIDETLSMALLVLLERLTPVERAVFLLHDVFGFKYAEIASTLAQDEANCRQILHRARQHVGTVRQRFTASPQEHHELLHRFVEAGRNGDLEGLIKLLSSDVVLTVDGGGIAAAIPTAIRGANKVARRAIAFATTLGKNLVIRAALINAEPGLISYANGKPFSVVVMNIRHGKIRAMYIVINPQKLSHLPTLDEAS